MHRPTKINHSHTFGGQRVTPQERDRRMMEIFHRLAPYYDRLCDVQSLGLHRYWRRVCVRIVAPRPGQRILDLAGGCGEMARRLAGPGHQVIILEPSIPMIDVGRSRGIAHVEWVAGLARAQPFPDASMDTATCAFGIRNVTFVEPALREVLRVLRPGGRFCCLEASQPWASIRPLYAAFCRYVVPRLGAWVTRVPEAYDYLVESIVDSPDREVFKRVLEDAGFADVRYRSLSLGIVCIHVGTKP
jgi:demethylmenaquinone methyltransferase/2-methoxy-6-polyprenyl-1,4-benzoquinol methylase